jgi:hypothetical protein
MFKNTLLRLKTLLAGIFEPVIQEARSLAVNHLVKFIFLVIPVVYLLVTTIIHYSLGPFFMGRVDPEYFYMYNGIVLGAGNLSIQFFYHPGTPLHFIIALSARIIDLFQPGDYMKNFVDDPEKYIHVANLTLNVLVSIFVYFSGIKTREYTGSLAAGLVFQLIPFGSASLLILESRVFADALLLIPLLITGLMVIRSIYQEPGQREKFKDIFIFGLLIGFGTACKLTFLPVILIPLVILPISFKRKIKLILLSFLSFLIFAYPVIFNIRNYWDWVFGLFIHSGKYGYGESDFIDFSTIPGNFIRLIKFNQTLFLVSLISLMAGAMHSFNFIKKRCHDNHQIRLAIFAVNLSLLFALAFTLKHFEIYYFAPFNAYIYLLILLTGLLILSHKGLIKSKVHKAIFTVSFFVVILVVCYGQVLELRVQNGYSNQKKAELNKEYAMIIPLVLPDRPIILTGPYYGSPFIEFAQHAGYVRTVNMRGFYTAYLKEKYPDTYFYLNWTDKFEFWNDFVDVKQILDKADSSFYVYIGKENGSDLVEIEKRLLKYLDENSVYKKVLFQDKSSDEQLIEFMLINN